jgi:hypothetical protein
VSRKVRVLPGALAVSMLERASVELADVVVSPSAYMLGWMERQGWRLPTESHVVPYVTRTAATGESSPRAGTNEKVERVTFFGRLEERKGLRPFIAGVNALDSDTLARIELEFIGSATPAWPPQRIETMLTAPARSALRRISFETALDQHGALARLSQPGTLAVMPSLEDNSPNTVYECLERGISFIASDAGGTSELIAPEDRARVLFEPTPEGVAAALRRALSGTNGAAAPGFDARAAVERWAEIVALSPDSAKDSAIDTSDVHVTIGDRAGRTSSPWVLLLEPGDEPDERLVETLVEAQRATGADVVTCAVRAPAAGGRLAEHYFVGDPGALGVLSNAYGCIALIRTSLLTDVPAGEASAQDPDWPLLARLSAQGAQIVSVPVPLATRSRRPGTLRDNPADALLVAQALEQALPAPVRGLARLAAGLAADADAAPSRPASGSLRRVGSVVKRSLRRR